MEILPEDSSAKDLFFRAMKQGSLEMVKGMVSLGANINWREDTEVGATGLQLAVLRGSMEKLKFLLSKGADVNLVSKRGLTPLMIACCTGQPAMVARLCRVPAINLNSQDSLGVTALMYAASRNKVQCVEKLRSIAGVDWNAVSKFGYSAVMLAVGGKAARATDA